MKTLNAVVVVIVAMVAIILGTIELGKLTAQYEQEERAKVLAELVYEDGLLSYCKTQLQTEVLKENIQFWNECSDTKTSSGLSAGQWYRHHLASGEVIMPTPTPNGDKGLILVKKLEASFNDSIETQIKEGTMSTEEADDLRESIQFVY